MIDNFTPQPYPLEVSPDGGTSWHLVLGWRLEADELVPVLDADGFAFRQVGAVRSAQPPRATASAEPRRTPA